MKQNVCVSHWKAQEKMWLLIEHNHWELSFLSKSFANEIHISFYSHLFLFYLC